MHLPKTPLSSELGSRVGYSSGSGWSSLWAVQATLLLFPGGYWRDSAVSSVRFCLPCEPEHLLEREQSQALLEDHIFATEYFAK